MGRFCGIQLGVLARAPRHCHLRVAHEYRLGPGRRSVRFVDGLHHVLEPGDLRILRRIARMRDRHRVGTFDGNVRSRLGVVGAKLSAVGRHVLLVHGLHFVRRARGVRVLPQRQPVHLRNVDGTCTWRVQRNRLGVPVERVRTAADDVSGRHEFDLDV